MNDEFRGHSPLPNAEEIAWMSIEPFAAIRRVALLAALAFAVATALSPAPQPVIPAPAAQPSQKAGDVDAHGGVLAASGWAPASTGSTLSGFRPLV